MSAKLSLYTDFASAGGELVGPLGGFADGTVVTRLDGDDRCTVRVSRSRWTELGGNLRQVLRVVWPEGTAEEFRVSKVALENASPYILLEALPVFADLVTGGLSVSVVAGVPQTHIRGEKLVSEWLTASVLSSSAATRLNVTLGTIERNVTVPLDVDLPTAGALIRSLLDKSGQELELTRNGDTSWVLNFRIARGSTVSALSVTDGRNLLALAASATDANLATVVIPVGDEDASGQRATIATVRYEVTSVSGNWVTLQDPESGVSPIQVDSQWVGAWLATPDNGVSSQITGSSATTGAVLVASATGFVSGQRVTLCSSAAGAPQIEVYDSDGVLARGRRAVPVAVSGLRGEANELTNSRYENGLNGWSGLNQGASASYVEVKRSELNQTVTGAANGARAASTSTATPLALKNLPANSWVRQQDEIKVGGLTYTVSSDVIASTTGTLALPISPALAGTYADNTAITLERRQTLSLTLTTARSVFSGTYDFDANTANDLVSSIVYASSKLSNATYSSNAGIYALGGFQYLGSTGKAGALRLTLATAGGATGLNTIQWDWASKATDVFTITASAFSWPGSGDVGTLTYSAAAGTIQIGLRVRFNTGSGYRVGIVTAFTSTTLTLQAETSGSFNYVSSSFITGYPVYGSMLVIPAGTVFTFDILRESRTLNLNGAHNSGATTLNTKAVAALSTRNWLTSDQVQFAADVTITIAGGTVTFLGDDGEGTYQWQVTYNESLCNIELLEPSDFSVSGVIGFNSGGPGACNLTSVDKVNNIAYFNTYDIYTSVFASMSGVATLIETHNVSAAASWQTNGTVTLSLATAISTTRFAKPRGMRVWWPQYKPLSSVYVEMYVSTAPTHGATSIVLFGTDANGSMGSGSFGVLYRVIGSASKVPFAGNVLYAASSTQANGSGVASVTVTAANPNAIVDNDLVTITRPALLRSTDPTTGSVVRLVSAVGGTNQPIITTAGLASPAFTVVVPTGETRTVKAFVTFSLSQGSYPLGQQPAISVITTDVVGWARLADAGVDVVTTPTVARIIVSVTLTETRTLRVVLHGGPSDGTRWIAVLDAMLSVTANTDTPYVSSSWANLIAQRGIDVLRDRRLLMPDLEVDLTTLRSWTDAPSSSAPVVVGQSVSIPAYGVTRRITTVTRSLLSPDDTRVEMGTVATDLSRRVAKLLAGG
jgi:hypothetical protein